MRFVSITPENQHLLALYRDIRERDLIGREHMFIAEGKVVLAVLLRGARFTADSILVSERKLPGLMPLLEETQPQCPIYVAPSSLLDNVAGFAVHRGILAVGKRKPSPPIDEFLAGMPDNALLVALNCISNHDNIGAVFRNAAAFAADGVLLDNRCCDPLYRKAIRVSVGAALRVPYAQNSGESGDVAALCGSLRKADFQIWAMSGSGEIELAEAAAQYHPARVAGQARKTALLFGSEGEGLPPAILDSANPFHAPTVRIPIAADFDSLNIATASGIALSAFADPAKLR